MAPPRDAAPPEEDEPPLPAITLERAADHYVGHFRAMASPCSVMLDTDDAEEALELVEIAARDAARVEARFSRYRPDSVVQRINGADGASVRVDEETAGLIDYAVECYELSEGLFDITSGVLRRAWTFDGGAHGPDEAALREALPLVGWHRVRWQEGEITLLPGMEIDLGGLAKEYAVDRAAALIARDSDVSCVVNFGGDLFAGGPRRGGRPWGVGVDDPERTGEAALYRVDLELGGLATSGDARRFVLYEGRRLGHILDPRTGWPVADAPRSVTVVAGTCLEAGTLATLACLQGPGAVAFLEGEGVQFRVI